MGEALSGPTNKCVCKLYSSSMVPLPPSCHDARHKLQVCYKDTFVLRAFVTRGLRIDFRGRFFLNGRKKSGSQRD